MVKLLQPGSVDSVDCSQMEGVWATYNMLACSLSKQAKTVAACTASHRHTVCIMDVGRESGLGPRGHAVTVVVFCHPPVLEASGPNELYATTN